MRRGTPDRRCPFPFPGAFYSSASYAPTVNFVRLESGFGLICFPSDWMAAVAVLTSVTSGFSYFIVFTSFLRVLTVLGRAPASKSPEDFYTRLSNALDKCNRTAVDRRQIPNTSYQ